MLKFCTAALRQTFDLTNLNYIFANSLLLQDAALGRRFEDTV